MFVAVNAWITAKMARKGDKWRGLQGVVDEVAPLVRWGFVYSSLLESLVRNVRSWTPLSDEKSLYGYFLPRHITVFDFPSPTELLNCC